jgi:lactam utilization protein B
MKAQTKGPDTLPNLRRTAVAECETEQNRFPDRSYTSDGSILHSERSFAAISSISASI